MTADRQNLSEIVLMDCAICRVEHADCVRTFGAAREPVNAATTLVSGTLVCDLHAGRLIKQMVIRW